MIDEFCYLNKQSHPYDFKIVEFDERNPREYMTISARVGYGLKHMSGYHTLPGRGGFIPQHRGVGEGGPHVHAPQEHRVLSQVQVVEELLFVEAPHAQEHHAAEPEDHELAPVHRRPPTPHDVVGGAALVSEHVQRDSVPRYHPVRASTTRGLQDHAGQVPYELHGRQI